MKKDLDVAKTYIAGLLLAGNLFFVGRLVNTLDTTSNELQDFKLEHAQQAGELKGELLALKVEVKRMNTILLRGPHKDATYRQIPPVLHSYRHKACFM